MTPGITPGYLIGVGCDGCGQNVMLRVSPSETFDDLLQRVGYVRVTLPGGEAFAVCSRFCLGRLAHDGRKPHRAPGQPAKGKAAADVTVEE